MSVLVCVRVCVDSSVCVCLCVPPAESPGDSEACIVSSPTVCALASSLLQCDDVTATGASLGRALTTLTRTVAGTPVTSPLTVEKAEQVCGCVCVAVAVAVAVPDCACVCV